MEKSGKVAQLRICWFGIWNGAYPRNHILRKGLKELGHELVDCQVPQDGGLKKHVALILKFRSLKNQCDIIYVAYPSPSVVLWARLFGRGHIVVDAFYSMYDAVVHDRKEISPWHPRAWKLGVLDWLSVALPDLTIFDTKEHETYMKSWWGLSKVKTGVVPIGVDDEKMCHPPRRRESHEPFRALFFGNYIPLHGVQHIVEAAKILKDDARVVFRFVGVGQDFKSTRSRIEKENLTNVEIIDRKVPHEEVVRHIGESDIILGIFGDTPKARRVVPNKVFEALACRKPVITMDTPGIRELFNERHLQLVRGDGSSIAEAIVHLIEHEEEAQKLSDEGFNANSRYFPARNAQKLVEHLRSL